MSDSPRSHDSSDPVVERGGAAIMMIAALAVTGPIWWEMLETGCRSASNGHVLLAPIVAGYLAWYRRRELRWSPGGNWWGATTLSVGLLALRTGTATHTLAAAQFGAVAVLIGSILTWLDRRSVRVLLPTFGALLFAIPVPGTAVDAVSVPLAEWTARLVANGLGSDVAAAGNVIVLPNAELQVAEACGGLPLVGTMLLMAYGICAAIPFSTTARVVIFATSLVLVLIANLARLAIVAVLYRFDADVGASFHDLSGAAFVGLAWLLPYSLSRCFRRNGERPRSVERGRSKDRSRLPILASSLLIASTGLVQASRPLGVDDTSDSVQSLLDRLPLRISSWIGRDADLPARQLAILQPDALLHREYVHLDTDETLLLTVAFHRDGRDHARHRAARCYRALGWQLDETRPSPVTAGSCLVSANRHVFSRRHHGRRRTMNVFEVVVVDPAECSHGTTRILLVSGSEADVASTESLLADVVTGLEFTKTSPDSFRIDTPGSQIANGDARRTTKCRRIDR